MKRLLVLLALLAGTASADAQTQPSPLDDLPIRHVTDALMQRPEAQQARVAYQQRLAGTQARLQAAVDYQVGDTRQFKVLNLETYEFDTLGFTLKRVHERFLLWIETPQLDSLGRDSTEVIDVIHDALAVETPAGSHNTGRGIIVNNEQVFGLPPDVDGDGKSDVLLLDVRDGWQPDEGFVAGFVTSADLSKRQGNGRDVLYLDTRPGLYAHGERRSADLVAATAAHEYQHLIHYNYDLNESTFLNEGLAEWAELLNGYVPRAPRYLTHVARYNVPLLRWSEGMGSDVMDDYQRAGLFTNYLAERLGVAATGALAQDWRVGTASYRYALGREGVALHEFVLDYHTANLLNDTSVEERFGYLTPQRTDIGAALSHPSVDGATSFETAPRADSLLPGGALFLEWTDVEDFALTFDVIDTTASGRLALRDDLHLRAILQQDGGVVTTRDFAPKEEPELFTGAFDRVAVVAAHVAPAKFDTVHVAFSATWSTATTAETRTVPDGLALEPAFPNPFSGRATLRYHLPQSEHVRLTVFDVLGRRVATLVDAAQPAGTHRASLDGTTLASGVYVVHLTAGARTLTRTLTRVD